MELLVSTWRYLVAEPCIWIVNCFFRPTRFQQGIEIPGYFNLRRIVPTLRAGVFLSLCFFPLFCAVVGADIQVRALEIDSPTLFSLIIWYFLGCIILDLFGGIILGIARGITLAISWNILYTVAVLYTSLHINETTLLIAIVGFGIVGGILFGTAFGMDNDFLGDIAGSLVWTAGVFLIRMGIGQTWDIGDWFFLMVLAGCIIGSIVWFLIRNMRVHGGARVVKKSLLWGNIWGMSVALLVGVLASTSTNTTALVIVLVIAGSYALFCFFSAVIYLLGYWRLFLYPFSCFSSLRAYVASRLQPSYAFDALHRCSLYWDECVFLPLPGLKQTLFIAAQQGRSRIIDELAFITYERPQQNGIALVILQELAISDLAARGNLNLLSLAHKQQPLLFLQESASVDPLRVQLFFPFIEASLDADHYLKVKRRWMKRNTLSSMIAGLRRASPKAQFRENRLNERASKVIMNWLAIAEKEQEQLGNTPFVVDQLDNPFSAGPALKPEDGLFVGRRDLVQQLEESLGRGDRRPTFLLNGERRMGKSSILHQLPAMLGPRYLPLFYDLQKADILSSTITFLMDIAGEIDKTVRSRGIHVARLEYARLQEANQKNEAAVYLQFTEWLQSVEKNLEREDKTLLLTFDEFEALAEVQGTSHLHPGLLLNWFRNITQDHPRLALLFSGIRTFGEMGSEWVNRFATVQTLRVSFLRRDDVHQLITQPDDPDFSAHYPFSEDIVEEIIRVTACHPFMVQAVCSALIKVLNREKRFLATMPDVAVAINDVFDGWSYFEDLWLNADDHQQKCLAALANAGECSLSVVAQLAELDQQATWGALQNLRRRDLVLAENGTYRIIMPLFCEWVKRHLNLSGMEREKMVAHQPSTSFSDAATSDQSDVAILPLLQPASSSLVISPSRQFSDVARTQLPQLSRHQPSRRAFVGGAAGLALLGITAACMVWFTRPRPAARSALLPLGTLMYTYYGPGSKIRVLAWSPDNQRLAAGSDDYTAHVWDAATGNHPLIYRGHNYFVEGLAWSPDSKRIVTGSADTTVQIWNPADGSHIYTYRGHSLWVNRVSWSHDGKYIVSGEQGGIAGHPVQARVWKADTGETISIYNGHHNGIFAVAWSPVSTRVASCGYDGTLQVWDGMTGNPICICRDNVANFGLAWSPDGQRIAVACSDTLVRVIDANTGRVIYVYRGHKQAAEDVAWSPNGTTIASSGGDSTVQIFNAATSRNLFTYREQSLPLAAVTWSPDGAYIASGSDNGTVQVWYAHV